MKKTVKLVLTVVILVGVWGMSLRAEYEATDFYLLCNTQSASALGEVKKISGSTGEKTAFADLLDAGYTTGMYYWQGFATNGEQFYLLNTSAGNGRIQRVPLDGSSRTDVVDIDPDPYGSIEQWHGFATDGEYFYLMRTSVDIGRIDRINMNGSGKTTLVSSANNTVDMTGVQGFGCDGRYFYYLNSNGSEPAKGTIYRTNMDGSGLTTIRDLSPDEFGYVEWYDGFAVYTRPAGTMGSIQ